DLSLVGGEDGLALVKWVREDDRFSELPVIALTAHAFVSDREKCMDAGCNDFITKPIFRSQLLEIIQKNLKT
ncbi:MAG: response regulator, partial [Candidatus Marinimicrobia bacterium]|nr:response regulator [Candidatus Neomarinimicrobiota bacterium]